MSRTEPSIRPVNAVSAADVAAGAVDTVATKTAPEQAASALTGNRDNTRPNDSVMLAGNIVNYLSLGGRHRNQLCF